MSSCIICGKELKTPCEETYGVCKEDARKVKELLSFAMSFKGLAGNDVQ